MALKVDTSYNNFARGKIDHDMMGRYDLPIYQTGADLDENFITNFKGNAIYRAGFETMESFQDCVFVEFKFNNQQQYICVFYANTMRLLSYDSSGVFGWVLQSTGPDVILEVTTPYSLAQSRLIQFTQNDDEMIVTVQGLEPRKLKRVSANSFTFLTYSRKLDPFPLTFDSTKNITAITQATEALVSVAAHGLSIGDRVKFAGVVGMTQINDWVGAVVSVPTAGTFTVDIDTTSFTAYSSAGTIAEVLTGSYPKCCLFYKARLFYAATTTKITTLWASVQGQYYDHTKTPVTVTTALEFTLAEISQEIEWLFPGDNSLIVGASDGIVAVNGGGVNEAITAENIEATLTSAQPCNGVYPVKKDGLVFYMGVDGRNMYYFQYDILKEAFQAADANFLSYDITDGGITKMRHKKDKNDLIFGTTGNDEGSLLSCNFQQEEKIIGWHDHLTEGEFKDIAVITDNNGAPQLFVLALRDGDYFIERQGPYIEFKRRVKFFTGRDNKAADDMAYTRFVAEKLKQCIYLDNSIVYNNLKSNLITYNSVSGEITAAVSVFTSNDVGNHIVYKTLTGYESGRFEITGYVSGTVVEVSVLQEPTSNTYTDWYLSFNSLSGLTDFASKEISVVSDGGYLDDIEVSAGGAIEFGKEVTHVVLGYRYKGILKSFALGFQVQGVNTQRTMKAITEFSVRCMASAGLEVGASLYKLEPVQELTQNDLNYLPPLPIDGTKSVAYSDDHEGDKFFYIVQDQPLPACVTSVMLTSSYAVTP